MRFLNKRQTLEDCILLLSNFEWLAVSDETLILDNFSSWIKCFYLEMYPLNQCFASIFYTEKGWNMTFTEKLSHKYRKQISENLKLILILTANLKSRTCKRKVTSAKPHLISHCEATVGEATVSLCKQAWPHNISFPLNSSFLYCYFKLCGSLRNIIPRVCEEFSMLSVRDIWKNVTHTD